MLESRAGLSSATSDPGPREQLLAAGARAAAPLFFLALLLLVATGWQGAYAIRYWGPPAAFALVVLGAVQLGGGGMRLPGVWGRVAVAAIWTLAAWSMLSMLWAASAGDAWIGSARNLLYAALFTLPIVLNPGRRGLELLGAGLLVGIAVIALITLVRLLDGDQSTYLAGRLSFPVGYRNATACLFSIAFWPLIALTATRDRRRIMRGLALSGATLMLGLAFLTQSRGMVIGLALGGAVAILAGPDRLRRTWLALVAVAIVAATARLLLTPYDAYTGGDRLVSVSDIRSAAVGLVGASVLGFVVGALFAVFDRGLRAASPRAAYVRLAARVGLVAVAVALAVAALIAVGNPVSYASAKWNEFRDLNAATTSAATRLTTASGQRYDLWRVAVDEWAGQPVLGVGQGGYRWGYYQRRATDRNLDNAHSLVFEVGSNLGLVGLVAGVVFLVSLGGLLATRWRAIPPSVRRSASAFAAAGAVVIGQSLVDWMYLIPGIIGLGLLSLGLAAAHVARPATDDVGPARPLPIWARIATGVPPLLGAVVVVLLFLSDDYTSRARGDATTAPTHELSAARTAAALDPLAVTPLYLEASALESMGRRRQARQKLGDALELEPRNFITLGLIGDFDIRSGDRAGARHYYQRAAALNPLDTGLRQLAQSRK
jgi:hypothetical protein